MVKFYNIKSGDSVKLDTACVCCKKDKNKDVFYATFKGVQIGVTFDLHVFICLECTTSRGYKTNKLGGLNEFKYAREF